MKILAWTPTHPDYGVKPQTWQSINAAIDAYDGPVHWVISANDNPYEAAGDRAPLKREAGYRNVTHQHNTARQMLLNGDYDALLSVEADMVIPADTIQRLIDLNADVAYGLYVWRHARTKNRWSAYRELTLWGGESVSLDHTGQEAQAVWQRAIDVKGVGMGCTLIKRRVLKEIEFRLYEGKEDDWLLEEVGVMSRMLRFNIDPYKPRYGLLCDDWYFALDAEHYGFTQRCDLGLVCGHVNGDAVLWPDPDDARLYREEVI